VELLQKVEQNPLLKKVEQNNINFDSTFATPVPLV